MFFSGVTINLRVSQQQNAYFTCFISITRKFYVFLANNTRGCLFYKGGGRFTRGVIFISFMADFFLGVFLIFPELLIFDRFFEVQAPMQRWALFWPFLRGGLRGGGLHLLGGTFTAFNSC